MVQTNTFFPLVLSETIHKVYINGIERFWSYAKGKLLKFHGLSPKLFPLYLKELEFRYNKRDKNLYEELLNVLGAWVD